LRFEKDDAPELKQIVAALIDALKDDNRPVRTMAAETLQKFSKDAVPLLLKIVKEGPPESQAGAAFGLGRLHENAPPPESVAALHALLKDAKGETRTAVIASLGEFSSDAREALPDLVAVLRDDSPELRITAALALEKISAAVHDTTLPVLFQALATGAPSHRLEIVTALDRWNLEVVAASVKDAAPALISVLDDSNQEVRRRAIQALVKIARGNKDALPVVAEALKHPQPLVRIGATSVFVTLGTDGKDAAPKLAELLQHDDLLIRDVAAQMLLRVAPKAPEAALAARLINEATAYRACKAYVLAQTRYKARADGGDYAQTLRGNRSLFESKTGAADLKFIAKAIADAEGEPGKGAVVYSAYRFKILKGQGTGAPGGAKSYVEKNRMTQGHALAAYPAKFDAGGRLTFLVSDEGTVYYKDLGADTATIVSKMSEFNPDEGWKAIRDADVQIDEMKF
jgi:HEAT repeat protein